MMMMMMIVHHAAQRLTSFTLNISYSIDTKTTTNEIYNKPAALHASHMIGAALSLIHANGRSAVDTSVMLSMQL